jgi:protein-L-isoaspartate(D-aspartate) O-methyltransferase
MVREQIAGRGVRTPQVLEAMHRVRREAFLPHSMAEFAYEDAPLPIDEDQTISQPYIVALMVEALDLKPSDKVLEVGTGSGYAAAVLAEVAGEVFTVERFASLAQKAAVALQREGYHNVHVLHGDGTVGWPDHAPYDAIIVAAGGPQIPQALKAQLKVGGRMVIPVGPDAHSQELVRVRRVAIDEWKSEDIADVRFVPLIGEEGWEEPPEARHDRKQRRRGRSEADTAQMLRKSVEPFADIDQADLAPLMRRIGDARLVLLGEASHGTSEFYRMRARITQELIAEKGFDIVAVEADWPDAARIDHYIRHAKHRPSEWTAFARFPTWMWRNREVRSFVDWLRSHNMHRDEISRAGFYGLDLYSMYNSIRAVLDYLEKVDPETARIARERYGCLTPWQSDPAVYGRAALSGHYRTCEGEVARMLADWSRKRMEYALRDGEQFLDAVQNARLIANAERYYRIMYYGSRASWNLRDEHMFKTLENLLAYRGKSGKAVIWAHNSHLGDARATEMSARGEFNLGELCRKHFADAVYSVGFGTDSGTVAAASDWDGPMEVKDVRPAIEGSYEKLFHQTGHAGFFFDLRSKAARTDLPQTSLERAIGVIYRPETERESHYFEADLARQFDEYIWIDKTRAVAPLGAQELAGMPETYPFGL